MLYWVGMFSGSCVAQATRLFVAPPSEGADGRLLASPLGELPHFKPVSAVFSLFFVKATEVARVFHLAVAWCLLPRVLMPPSGRRAAVNAVLSVFFVCFFNSLYAERVSESLPCIYLISQQSRDTVVTSVAGMLLYVSWQLKKNVYVTLMWGFVFFVRSFFPLQRIVSAPVGLSCLICHRESVCLLMMIKLYETLQFLKNIDENVCPPLV